MCNNVTIRFSFKCSQNFLYTYIYIYTYIPYKNCGCNNYSVCIRLKGLTFNTTLSAGKGLVFYYILFKLHIINWINYINCVHISIYFIYSCITPTRCSESLWLINNMGRDHYRDGSYPEFYYHDYHRHVSDVLPPSIHQLDPENKNKEPDNSLDYDEVPYIPHYEPVISFVQLYIPWSSKFGAMMYIVSLLSVLGAYTPRWFFVM